MSIDPRLIPLALSLTPGIGGKTLNRILARNELLGRNAIEFQSFSTVVLIEDYGLKSKIAEEWIKNQSNLISQASETLGIITKLKVSMVTTMDAAYPQLIEGFDPDPPAVLFLYGNTKLLQTKTFCVMASRNAPPSALNTIESLTEEGTRNGEVLVSGHNTNEYRASAIVPLRWGAPRILALDRELFEVLGSQLNQEPFQTARLWRHEFDPQTDLAISAVAPKTPSHPAMNRQRDKLIVSLSRRMDLVWASAGGGMEKLARQTLKSQRLLRVCDLFPGAKAWTRDGANMIEL